MRARRLLVPLACLALATAAFAAAEPGNVLLSIEIGKLESGRKVSSRTYQLVAPANGQRVQLNTGNRVPIPTNSFPAANPSADSKDAVTVSSFTYQNVGFVANLKARRPGPGTILVDGSLDASLLRGGNPPMIGNFSLQVDLELEEGVPLRIAQVEEPGAESFYVEMEAATMKEGRASAR